jgi:diguanylate cyclase (GGDEF)-like protein
MEGYDRGWNDAGPTRVAHYTNLAPGEYVFRVSASNNDGVWSTDATSVHFSIVPTWHQTWWFRTLLGLAGLAALGAIYRMRLWQLRARERELRHEVAQRTEALREANERLQRLASVDSLTHIANRGAFNQRLERAWREHASASHPLAVLLCDIDAFKAYNDTYGHLAGDAALSAVAAALSRTLRDEGDLAARYGGEEFAVLLPSCDLGGALELAQRMLRAVRDLGIEHRASGVAPQVTISIGVASLVPDLSASPEILLMRADDALYRAKAEGRDRIAAEPINASAAGRT